MEVKSRRGGRRPGAGRKPEGYVRPSSLSELAKVSALATEPPAAIDSVAQRHAPLALEALVRLLSHGASEAARIAAANEILDRGYGKPTVEIGGDAAVLVTGVPPAPVSVTSYVRSEARRYANLAIEVLRKIASDGSSETAIAAASRALLGRGLGTVGKARMQPQRERPRGKKEEAARAAAAAATGRYATPPPPRSTMN